MTSEVRQSMTGKKRGVRIEVLATRDNHVSMLPLIQVLCVPPSYISSAGRYYVSRGTIVN